MATLTKDQILGIEDLPSRAVTVPEWGGDVYIRSLSGKERDAWEASMASEKGRRLDNYSARLVAACLADDKGKPLFSGTEVEDLGEKNGKVLERLFFECREHNFVGAQSVEEGKKNSEPDPSDASTSG